ncbi:MAG: hypothetical protein K1Y36_12645 [Blastocatellia bacterium]|nr:hypothetical protein [Blastocatellia bacterium]
MTSTLHCPRCGFVNSVTVTACIQCGSGLFTQQAPNPYLPTAAPVAPQQPHAPPPAFGGYSTASPPAYGMVPSYGLPPQQLGFGTFNPLPDNGIWQHGNELVMHKQAVLPDVCVVCNCPAEGVRLRKKLRWHSPWLLLLLLVNVIVFAVVASILQKRATVDLGVCEKHLMRHKNFYWMSWLLCVTGIIGLLVSISQSSGWIALGGVGLIVAGAVCGTMSKLIGVSRIDETHIWLKKVHPDLMAQFPNWLSNPYRPMK